MRTKKIFFIALSILCVVLILFAVFIAIAGKWSIKPRENITSIQLSVKQSDGYYSEFFIDDPENISAVRDSILDLQNKIGISNITSVREAAAYQKDPQISMIIMYDDILQMICVQKDQVIIFDRRNPDDTYKYLLQLDNMQTDELLSVLYSFAEPEENI